MLMNPRIKMIETPPIFISGPPIVVITGKSAGCPALSTGWKADPVKKIVLPGSPALLAGRLHLTVILCVTGPLLP